MSFNNVLVYTMTIMVYTVINHDYHGISHDFLLQILINCIPVCRIQLLPSARMPASPLAAQTRRQWTDDGAAMSTKSTRGCGRLGAASPAWGACPSCRLRKGMMLLLAKPGASVLPSQNGFAKRLQPDSK